ncbi:DDE-type integrase/transposase/recombinase [uncultured Corynebacterium sp.]|uniref:DDE-type integrase/transposase/recombinase n=1 Tax=uncultured Corynebacterium sp. TaxID=159447 RepID=UPI0025CB8A37|nr:DDE-type integrase/transposase/recombinase [uncultured Corynebacterium sp.]
MDTTLTQTLRDLEFTVLKVSAWTGLAVSSFHHRLHPGRRRVTTPIPHAQRRSDIALNHQERQAIADQLNQAPTRTVSQVFHHHLDSGDAYASLRSYYRIANTALCPTRYTPIRSPVDAATPQVNPPQLHATAPYETLVWDITFLPGLHRGQSYALHCVLDLYSRAIVGWQIDTSPNANVAATLFRQIGADARAAGFTISTIHSDNGRTMKSTAVKKICREIGAQRSYSRPHISDDNPHIESSFSTLKGDATYPKVFDDYAHAHQWVTGWVRFYNTIRYHPGLAHFTPDQLLTNTWKGQWAVRNQARQALYAAHPARYRYRPPVVAQPPMEVTFNITNTPDNISNRTVMQSAIVS